ncbi:MAG: FAD-dependent oxidoreductase, partial [Betaproteobacteria bacterium]
MQAEAVGHTRGPSTRDGALVVGAGMGGLACALSLAQRGLHVTLLDSAPGPGGKMKPLVVGGAAIDSGPTVFTMRWVFEQLFEQAGASFAERVPCDPLSVLAR